MKENNSILKRRVFLRNVGAGAFVTTGITGETIGLTDKISIPFIKRKDEVLEEIEVNERWWDNVKEARRICQKVREDFRDRRKLENLNYDPGSDTIDTTKLQDRGIIVNSFITSGKDKIGDRNKLRIIIYKVGPRLSFKKRHKITNIGTNIQIDVKDQTLNSTIGTLDHHCKNDDGHPATKSCLGRQTFDPVIGGISFGGYKGGETSVGTSGGRVQISGGEYDGEYMITNAHNFSGSNKEDNNAYQYEDHPVWGTTTDIYEKDSGLDYILVERNDNKRKMAGTILHRSNDYLDLEGRVTNQELAIGQDIYKTGKTTGAQQGTLDGVNSNEVIYNADCAPGDSGGPIYVREYSSYYGDYAALIGIHYSDTGGVCRETIKLKCNNKHYSVHSSGKGTKAEAIKNDIESNQINNGDVYFY